MLSIKLIRLAKKETRMTGQKSIGKYTFILSVSFSELNLAPYLYDESRLLRFRRVNSLHLS